MLCLVELTGENWYASFTWHNQGLVSEPQGIPSKRYAEQQYLPAKSVSFLS